MSRVKLENIPFSHKLPTSKYRLSIVYFFTEVMVTLHIVVCTSALWSTSVRKGLQQNIMWWLSFSMLLLSCSFPYKGLCFWMEGERSAWDDILDQVLRNGPPRLLSYPSVNRPPINYATKRNIFLMLQLPSLYIALSSGSSITMCSMHLRRSP